MITVQDKKANVFGIFIQGEGKYEHNLNTNVTCFKIK